MTNFFSVDPNTPMEVNISVFEEGGIKDFEGSDEALLGLLELISVDAYDMDGHIVDLDNISAESIYHNLSDKNFFSTLNDEERILEPDTVT